MARENQQLKRARRQSGRGGLPRVHPQSRPLLRTSPSESPEDAPQRDDADADEVAADDVDPVVRRLIRDAIDAAVTAEASRASATTHVNLTLNTRPSP